FNGDKTRVFLRPRSEVIFTSPVGHRKMYHRENSRRAMELVARIPVTLHKFSLTAPCRLVTPRVPSRGPRAVQEIKHRSIVSPNTISLQ
ncbi:hypothetical protein J6590_000701, partial [Homalodisca vitripennis]